MRVSGVKQGSHGYMQLLWSGLTAWTQLRCRRRPGDSAMGHNQKLQVMLGRVLRAEYSFPAHPPLRCVLVRCGCCVGAVWCSVGAVWCSAGAVLVQCCCAGVGWRCCGQAGMPVGRRCSPTSPAADRPVAHAGWQTARPRLSQVAPTRPVSACSEGVRDLISRILVVDPEKRPTIQVRGHVQGQAGSYRPRWSCAHLPCWRRSPSTCTGGIVLPCRDASGAWDAEVSASQLAPAERMPCLVTRLCAGDPAAPLVCRGAQSRSTELQRQHPAAQQGEPAAAGSAGRGALLQLCHPSWYLLSVLPRAFRGGLRNSSAQGEPAAAGGAQVRCCGTAAAPVALPFGSFNLCAAWCLRGMRC